MEQKGMKGVCGTGSSGMHRYCIRCPKFCFQFNANLLFPINGIWDRMMTRISSPFGLKGRLFCLCEYDYLEHVASHAVDARLSWKESSRLDNETYFRFDADSMPCSLKNAVESFTKKEPCILQIHKKECYYFVEREMEEWNRKK